MKKRLSLFLLLISVGLLTALAAGPVFGGGGGNGQKGLERAIAVQEKHTDDLMSREGVVGTAVGLNPAGNIAVLIYTEREGITGLPSELDGVDGVPAAVRVTGEFTALGKPGPVAAFTYSCSGYECSFDASSSKRADKYEWDFQNNGVFEELGVTASYTYPDDGVETTYSVSLSVTNAQNSGPDIVAKPVTVPYDGGTPPTPTPTPTPEPGGAVDPKSRFDRPVPIGVSSGSRRLITFNDIDYCTTGTLGVRVTDGTKLYALSNAHVYALEGSVPVLDPDEEDAGVADVLGDRISQPGRVDANPVCADKGDADNIGTLEAYSGIKFDGTANRIDAAIALVTEDGGVPRVGTATPSDGYGQPTANPVDMYDLFFRQELWKYGRTTGFTSGDLDGINATVNVTYDTGTARFEGQIIVKGKNILAGGDSGSLLVDINNNPVGLLFAGTNFGPGYSMANQIDEVLGAFQVDIDDGTPPAP